MSNAVADGTNNAADCVISVVINSDAHCKLHISRIIYNVMSESWRSLIAANLLVLMYPTWWSVLFCFWCSISLLSFYAGKFYRHSKALMDQQQQQSAGSSHSSQTSSRAPGAAAGSRAKPGPASKGAATSSEGPLYPLPPHNDFPRYLLAGS